MEDTQKQVSSKEKNKKIKRRVWMVLGFIAIVAIYLFITLRGQYLNNLELGSNYGDIFKQNLTYSFWVLAINFAFVFLAVYCSNKFIKKGLKAFFDEEKKDMPKLPNKSIALILGAIISIVSSPILTEKAMLSLNTAWFGISDPIFNLDIGYFFFQKPFIELLLYYALIVISILTVYTFSYYIIVFNVYFDGIDLQTLKKNTFVKQICAYVMIIALLIASLTFLNTQNFLNQKFLNVDVGSDTTIYGAGLTDVTIKLWGYRILSVLIVIAIAIAIRSFRNGKNKKAVISLLSIPAYLVILFFVMAIFQFLFVNSNELDREKKYISYNIENTKKAYNINIEEKNITNTGAITDLQVANNSQLISNIPIITKDVTLESLEEYQTSTGYYSYRNTNLALYDINNMDRLIYVSPREMESDDRRTYNSKTYEYTHGNGVILTDATKADSDGNIEYIQKDYYGNDGSIKVTEPRIYFGLKTNSNIIINSNYKKEFDYPISSTENAENIYDGEAGLKLNFIDRLILGITKGDLKLAFNTDITKDTKIITDRNIINRAKSLMPNFVYDDNPYMVVRDNGSLVWVLDAYTVSDSYPYSQESVIDINGTKNKINYIRNSVKIIIDAYNGTMQYYLIDRSDPVAMAYYNIYPSLFMPLDETIPEDIQNHIVYPKYLYDIQANILTRYHNIQTEVLYRNDDTWSIAKTSGKSTAIQKAGTKMDSYYTVGKPEGTETPELELVVPYTLKDKQNINAYLVGKYNNGNVLNLYKFNSDDNVVGIMQLENQIDRDDIIAKELESINTTGSRLIKEMIVVPVDSTLLYVEPIYQLLLNESKVPLLKKVVVASGNRVAIGSNLTDAISNLVSQQAVELDVQNTDNENGLIEAIIKANNNLKESSGNKDWKLMGSDIEKLQDLINQLETMKKEQEKEKLNNETINNQIDENVVVDEFINTVNE